MVKCRLQPEVLLRALNYFLFKNILYKSKVVVSFSCTKKLLKVI